MSVAIFPGSFDPITLGHLEIIRRASRLFDRVVVCIMSNSAKHSPMFTVEERTEQIRRVIAPYPNVTVDSSRELLAEYARGFESPVIVKGLRDGNDFIYELQLDRINRKLYPELETVFIPSSAEYAYLSSTVAREMANYGAPLGQFVPGEIIEEVECRAKQRRN